MIEGLFLTILPYMKGREKHFNVLLLVKISQISSYMRMFSAVSKFILSKISYLPFGQVEVVKLSSKTRVPDIRQLVKPYNVAAEERRFGSTIWSSAAFLVVVRIQSTEQKTNFHEVTKHSAYLR